MAVITLTEAKTLLQITDTSKDALITMLIPIIESDIKEYCNQQFEDAPTEPSWEAWMKLPASKMIGYQIEATTIGMKSESQGGYSYTKEDLAGGYPIGIMHSFDKVRMTRVGQTSLKYNYRDMRGWTAQDLATKDPDQGVQDADYAE